MADDNDDTKPTSKVGYKSPPEHGKFKKGQPSANPKGRPPKVSSLTHAVRDALSQTHVVIVRGRKVRMSAMEALAAQLKAEALSGSQAARANIIKILGPLDQVAEPQLSEEEVIKKHEEAKEAAEMRKQLSDFVIRSLDEAAARRKEGVDK